MLQHRIQGKLIAIHTKARNHAHRNFRKHAMDISLRHVGNMDLHVREPRSLDAIFQRIPGIGEACWIHHHPIKAPVRTLVNSVDRLAFQICIENLQLKTPSSGIIQKCLVEFIRSGMAVNLRLPLAQIGEVRSLNKNDFFYFGRYSIAVWVTRPSTGCSNRSSSFETRDTWRTVRRDRLSEHPAYRCGGRCAA